MLYPNELNKYIEELNEYAQYENTELGEYLASLVEFKNQRYLMSTQFKKAYEQEIIRQIKFMKKNFKWVEEVCEYSSESRKIKILKDIGSD
jgi:hypothetical protein